MERVSQLALRIRTLEPDGLILYATGQVNYREGQSARPENKDSSPDGLILYATGQVYYRESQSAGPGNKDSGT